MILAKTASGDETVTEVRGIQAQMISQRGERASANDSATGMKDSGGKSSDSKGGQTAGDKQ